MQPFLFNAFIVFFIAAGVLIGLAQIVQYFRRKAERGRQAWERFDMAALNLALSNPEVEALRRLIRHSRLADPESIFRDLRAFEVGVAREMDSHLSDRDSLIELSGTLASLRDKLGYARLPAGTRLYSSREIPEGQPVWLALARDPASKKYSAEVHDPNERELVLTGTGAEDEAAGFNPGVPAFVTLFQTRDAEYSFTSRVLRRESGGRLLSVAHVAEMARRQLREYVRLECRNEAAFHVIRSDPAPDLVKEAGRHMGLLNDIGGGGVNLRTAEEFHVGDVLLLSFTFMGEDFFGIKGRIVRLLPKTMHGERVFQNHISFVEMDNTLREKIVKYIFKKQREETPRET